jgi:hypothetical protein
MHLGNIKIQKRKDAKRVTLSGKSLIFRPLLRLWHGPIQTIQDLASIPEAEAFLKHVLTFKPIQGISDSSGGKIGLAYQILLSQWAIICQDIEDLLG